MAVLHQIVDSIDVEHLNVQNMVIESPEVDLSDMNSKNGMETVFIEHVLGLLY